MLQKIDLIPSSVKLLIAIGFDLFAISCAFFLAYVIRLGFDGIGFGLTEVSLFAIIAVSTLILFYKTHIYWTILRFYNAKSALKTVGLLMIVTAIFYIAGNTIDAFVPRSVPIVFFVIASAMITGVRASVGLVVQQKLFERREGVVVFGAGETGRQLVASLLNGYKYQPLAFIDQKGKYLARNIYGIYVYSLNDIAKLIHRYGTFKVLIAVPSSDPKRKREIITAFEPYALELLTIPSMSDIVSGKRAIDELREVSVDELLGREAVAPIPELLNANIEDKVVMVTGAGGSIGQELCRQIVLNKPSKLILFDVSEPALYQIDQELNNDFDSATEIVPLMGSVRNQSLVKNTMVKHKVNTIYHAAAYKHVPMVENNIVSGITNNVFGTAEVAFAAVEANVETFVLVSTDKAVRPTNVMGASKRMAELVLQALARRFSSTRFVMVRFGNVLGSSGSVVPLFRKQIKRGGPITVTHPDIIRYFMTIPEAAQLVVQAGAMGQGGDVFVLDMGKPVKIVDLAHKMTHLMGLTVISDDNPDGDIEIKFSGLRPGEKLYEELLIDAEATKTRHPRILSANEQFLTWEEVEVILNDLSAAMATEDMLKIKRILLAAPLQYQPADMDVLLQGMPSIASSADEQANIISFEPLVANMKHLEPA